MSGAGCRKHALLILVLAVTLALTGCRGNRELNELHIVHSAAIDEGEDGNIRLTAEIAKLTPEGQQPKGMQNPTFLLTSEGKSLFEAARLMRTESDRELLWGHTTVVLMSKDAARKGIAPYMDDIRRLRQFRNGTLLYVTEGKAMEALQISSPLSSITSQVLRGLTDGGESTALTHKTSLIEVYKELVNHYRDLHIPAVQVVSDPHVKGDKLLQTKGLYAFRGDRLVGLLSSVKTKGFMRLINEFKGGLEKLPCSSGEGGEGVTLENISNVSKIRPQVDSSLKASVLINVFADLNMTSLHCKSIEVTPEIISEWENILNQNIAGEIRQFLQYSQEHKTDLTGIGEEIHRHDPVAWKKIKERWSEIYASIPFDIQVHTRIDHTNFIK
ncbi:Ger(x)C family spore germination protein [Paenibacillus filicis]|uniref:Ger(X)C family spore germination protein n=1 Tax=Paenibacillus filicis TaxID=669464 RepID=A0ABU9DK82_9BACL